MLSRRSFLQRGLVTAGAFAGLDLFLNRAWGGEAAAAAGFGPLVADPQGIFDLPAGFSYRVISRAGERTELGYVIPGAFDGMGAFAGTGEDRGLIVLVRNHELDPLSADRGPFTARTPEAGICYDDGAGASPGQGGTTTVVYDPLEGRVVRQFLSLAGTTRNCAGGPTPWGSWISCEETTERAGPVKSRDGRGYVNAKDHGFAFEVPATSKLTIAPPVPLTAMGRFRREAVAVHAGTGIIYQTEDDREGVLYRFLPAKPGKLALGGRLEALRIRDFSGDTTNWDSQDVAVGQSFHVDWVEVRDPLDTTAKQARENGATRFTRGEGIWMAGDRLWFACTDGGKRRKGQIWQLEADRLTLFCQPDDAHLLENGDNLTLAPWGDLLVCEDTVGDDLDPGQHLVGITPQGQPYHLGRNALNRAELSGVCCAPDGKTLFVNIFDPGLTLAITGPWKA
jgi:hypothetical protein